MNRIQIPGFSTINSNGQFHFESGYPSGSHIMAPVRQRGVLDIRSNACADFIPDPPRVYLPPFVASIAQGDGYHIKRTSRNYIIQVKVPVCESRRETTKRLKGIMAEVVGEITMDRMG